MARDASRRRGDGPFVFANLKSAEGREREVDFVLARSGPHA